MNAKDKQPEVVTGVVDDVPDIVGPLPDESGMMIGELDLPEDHWLFDEPGSPPMGSKLGTDSAVYHERTSKLIAAGKYAIRASILDTSEVGFDPDAFIQNLVVGLHGYATPSGDKGDE